MKTVKYFITDYFDNKDFGDTVNSIKLLDSDSDNYSFIFHPPGGGGSPGDCASIELCRKLNGITNKAQMISALNDSYANITKKQLKNLIEKLQYIHINWNKLSKLND